MLHPELYLMLHHADARGLHDAAARDRLKVHLRRHWKQQLAVNGRAECRSGHRDETLRNETGMTR